MSNPKHGIKRKAGSSLSVSRLLSKGKRYDPSEAKKRAFYAKAKKLRKYHAIAKKELGASSQSLYQNDNEETITKPPQPDSVRQEDQTEEKNASGDIQPDSDDIDTGDSALKPKKRKVQTPSDGIAADGAKNRAKRLSGKDTDKGKGKHDFAQRAARTASAKNEQRRQQQEEREERQRRIQEAKEKRLKKKELLAERTVRGQPVMKNVVGNLLDRLQKQNSKLGDRKGWQSPI